MTNCATPHIAAQGDRTRNRFAGRTRRTMVRPRIFAPDTTLNADETWHAESLSAAKWRTERHSPLELRPGATGRNLVRPVRSVDRGKTPDQCALGRRNANPRRYGG